MIAVADLLLIAKERLSDAEALLKAHRYDGVVYLCGYAVEIALKHKICQTLNWDYFPPEQQSSENYKGLKTHKLEVLLWFTGIREYVKTHYATEWSAIIDWNPESRYKIAGNVPLEDVENMIDSTQKLLTIL